MLEGSLFPMKTNYVKQHRRGIKEKLISNKYIFEKRNIQEHEKKNDGKSPKISK